jgi:phage repressor protein C with HTH and peptisase S24 domain
MMPNFHPGDEVACLRVNEARFLQWGRVYVLDTEQGIVIKRIYDNGDSIRCASYNPEYPDFNVPKEDIRSYNLVVGALRL